MKFLAMNRNLEIAQIGEAHCWHIGQLLQVGCTEDWTGHKDHCIMVCDSHDPWLTSGIGMRAVIDIVLQILCPKRWCCPSPKRLIRAKRGRWFRK